MAKKVKHIHTIGDIVTFSFFDGGTYTGKITHLTYQGDNIDSIKTQYSLPTYRIHVPDEKYSRGYMVYSSMTDMRIEDAKTKQAVEEFWEDDVYPETNKVESELDSAIKKQKDFLEKH